MGAYHTKSVQLQGQIRRALRSGRYLPGDRVDPASLAAEFGISPMPVRLALERLIGDGILEHHARGGAYLPLPMEIELRDTYDWMLHLLQTACELDGLDGVPGGVRAPGLAAYDDDLSEATWQLFDAIADNTSHIRLVKAIRRTNDQLAPIRRVEHDLIDGIAEEFAALRRNWQIRDLPRLRAALREYHDRRRHLVPCITAALKRQHERRR